jgi:hypothetical protein
MLLRRLVAYTFPYNLERLARLAAQLEQSLDRGSRRLDGLPPVF